MSLTNSCPYFGPTNPFEKKKKVSNRLDTARQERLEPKRMDKAKEAIEALGYDVQIVGYTKLIFMFDGKQIQYFPYSGWATGASIQDGRGLNNLLKQIR